MRKASIDFEVYSEAGYTINHETGKVRGVAKDGKGGLQVVGTPVYAEDESTDIICMSYDLSDGLGQQLWTPMFPNPQDLFDFILSGGKVAGWNVTFEFYIWNLVATKKYGWPVLPLEQLSCTMARSRRYSLPGALGAAAKVLNVKDKDAKGKTLIQKLTRPHSLSSKRQDFCWPMWMVAQDYYDMYEYCRTDVEVESECSKYIPELTDYEYKMWYADQVINVRGVQVDTKTLENALFLLGAAEDKYTEELNDITGGEVSSVGEVEKMRRFIERFGISMPDVQKDTVKAALDDPELDEIPRRVLEIRQCLGSANVKKLRTLSIQLSKDGRLRNQYMYCGADRTGRASAGGVQLQNLTSKGPERFKCHNCGRVVGNVEACICGNFVDLERKEDWDAESVHWAIKDINSRNLNHLEKMWGDPIDALAGCLRGLFVPKPGHEFICCDFSAIEAVGLACLSRCQWRIDVFNSHGKIYEVSVAKIKGKTLEEYLEYRKQTGKHHPDRALGKVAELASGYGGWIGAWIQFHADEFMTEREMMDAIIRWRNESPEIVEFWGGQWRKIGPGRNDWVPELFGLEGAFIKALKSPKTPQQVNDITFYFDPDYDVMKCRLPSGRFLNYHRPRVTPCLDRRGRDSLSITFQGYNTNSQKGKIGWITMETYGGRLAENVTQAVCADIQFEAIVRLEKAGFPVVMHTHDEATAETPIGKYKVEQMESIMAIRPQWAQWWPIRVEGDVWQRYGK